VELHHPRGGRATRLVFAVSFALFLAGTGACARSGSPDRSGDGAPEPTASQAAPPAPTLVASSLAGPPGAAIPASERDLHPCGSGPVTAEFAPGVTVQRFRAWLDPPVKIGDRCITIVRIDPALHRFRLLTAAAEGGSRPVTEWLSKYKLMGVINASMYAESRRSIGLMVSGREVNNDRDNDKLGGFMAWDAAEDTKTKTPGVAFLGRQCRGFDLEKIRRRYRTIVQNYRLLDCDGKAIPWKDEKAFSAAAIGQDRAGRVVFIHSRTPHTMTAFASMLASPALSLSAAVYVEGGPEASLHVRSGTAVISEMGSYETDFRADDSNSSFWEIPNVIGFYPAK
jgi:uncharacterized protein YigE (DUF2233 family)